MSFEPTTHESSPAPFQLHGGVFIYAERDCVPARESMERDKYCREYE
jgi:hypothetical protein